MTTSPEPPMRSTPAERPAQWAVLAAFILICLGVAAMGASWTNRSIGDWYLTINKPAWNPPNWVFGPVWTVLYVMMAVSAWLVWRRQGFARAWLPMLLFGVQLLLNALWSVLFFGMRSPGLALIDIAALWLAIGATILAFARVDSLAAMMMVPYLAWVTFAAALNAMIWHIN